MTVASASSSVVSSDRFTGIVGFAIVLLFLEQLCVCASERSGGWDGVFYICVTVALLIRLILVKPARDEPKKASLRTQDDADLRKHVFSGLRDDLDNNRGGRFFRHTCKGSSILTIGENFPLAKFISKVGRTFSSKPFAIARMS